MHIIYTRNTYQDDFLHFVLLLFLHKICFIRRSGNCVSLWYVLVLNNLVLTAVRATSCNSEKNMLNLYELSNSWTCYNLFFGGEAV